MMRLVIGALALSLLAGCGIKSGLDRPDPMWNSDEVIAEECARQRAARQHDPRAEVDRRCELQSPQ